MLETIESCLMCGVAADALAAPFEGLGKGADWSRPTREVAPTDDSVLTFATVRSIVGLGGRVDPEDIAKEFVRSHRLGRVHGVGSSTLRALQLLQAGSHWASAGHAGEFSKGAGAAMRVAPLAFILDLDDWDERRVFRHVCEITHRNDEAFAAAVAVAVAIRWGVRGDWNPSEPLHGDMLDLIPDSDTRDRIAFRHSTYADFAGAHGTTGFAPDTVPAAFLAASVMLRFGFERGIECIVREGGDTDTIASIAGQIAGASSRKLVAEAPLNLITDVTRYRASAQEFAAVVDEASGSTRCTTTRPT